MLATTRPAPVGAGAGRPLSHRRESLRRWSFSWCPHQDLNLSSTGYEPAALASTLYGRLVLSSQSHRAASRAALRRPPLPASRIGPWQGDRDGPSSSIAAWQGDSSSASPHLPADSVARPSSCYPCGSRRCKRALHHSPCSLPLPSHMACGRGAPSRGHESVRRRW